MADCSQPSISWGRPRSTTAPDDEEVLECQNCQWNGLRSEAVISKLSNQPIIGGWAFHCPECGRYLRSLTYEDFMDAVCSEEEESGDGRED